MNPAPATPPTSPRPVRIRIAQGDPAGIGPEIAVRAAREWPRPGDARVSIVGCRAHLFPDGVPSEPGFDFVAIDDPDLDRPVEPGRPSDAGSRAAVAALENAVAATMAGEIDAIVTAPIHKENLRRVGYAHPGHTEFLAERSGSPRVAMMLACPKLRVVLATIHEPLARVPSLIERSELVETILLTDRSLREWGVAAPRIGVAGLNPHAGEGGLFGREEIETIAPAVADARARGADARGPFPADTLFHRAVEGEFDVVVAMYHDQGLVAIKTLDFHGGVNVTLGLPFVRTSPDHGTAYDLAGKGVARPDSTIAALDTAYRLAAGRRRS